MLLPFSWMSMRQNASVLFLFSIKASVVVFNSSFIFLCSFALGDYPSILIPAVEVGPLFGMATAEFMDEEVDGARCHRRRVAVIHCGLLLGLACHRRAHASSGETAFATTTGAPTMAASSTTTSTGRNSVAYRPLFMQQFGEFFSTVIVLFLFLVVPRRLERAFRRLRELFSQWTAKCMITC